MDTRVNRVPSVKKGGIHRVSTFSVAESLEPTEDCWMDTSESHRKTAGANLRVCFDGVAAGVFHRVGASRPRLVFEVRVSFLEASLTAFDSADGSGVLSQYAVDVPYGFRLSSTATPSIEDYSLEVLLWN
ncbi:hypothetical protein Y032_0860g2734 [Ancylostoma ceylanicum]|uniref:Uncharacterized protein n=1 Tax=Ancylostoma ceylanicum TaxID=53326 RepID=A0A016WAX1_9BILA|nr:hypothetical protein Y032_0860g2734 [Ancylostoma ceylanicum]